MKERYDFAISAKTKFPAIENLKAELQTFVLAPENRRDFQPSIDIELMSVGNLKELQLRVEICQKVGMCHNVSMILALIQVYSQTFLMRVYGRFAVRSLWLRF
jgi:hypothetical protein